MGVRRPAGWRKSRENKINHLFTDFYPLLSIIDDILLVRSKVWEMQERRTRAPAFPNETGWKMSKAAEIIRRFQSSLNALDLSAIDRFVSPRFISHVEGIPSNKALWKQALKDEIRAFQDITCSIDAIYEEGDRVFLQMTEEYRQIAPFFGRRIDGRKRRLTLLNSYRVENNLIAEIYPATVLQYSVLN
jgi:hypothetical protein